MSLAPGLAYTDDGRLTIRCDGCAHTETQPLGMGAAAFILTTHVVFNHKARLEGDARRLCDACARAADWPTDTRVAQLAPPHTYPRSRR